MKEDNKNKMEERIKSVVDLFAGAGGFIRGFNSYNLSEFMDEDSNNEIEEDNKSNYKYYLNNNDIDRERREYTQLVIQNCNITVVNKEQEEKVKKSLIKKIGNALIKIGQGILAVIGAIESLKNILNNRYCNLNNTRFI